MNEEIQETSSGHCDKYGNGYSNDNGIVIPPYGYGSGSCNQYGSSLGAGDGNGYCDALGCYINISYESYDGTGNG